MGEKTPIHKAQNDVPFQYFLAQSFGIPVEGTNDEVISHGFFWRGVIYITKIVKRYP